jgi:cytochrome c-type biogenesis protein CcmE
MKDLDKQQHASPADPRRPHLLKRKRVIFAVIVVALALGILVYIGMSQFTTYYLTVSEFQGKVDSLNGKQVRVTGQVVPESLKWDTGNVTLNFTISDGNASLPVVYKGVVPDTFNAGKDVVVEGKYDPQGMLLASKLITKCPSKYEPSQ